MKTESLFNNSDCGTEDNLCDYCDQTAESRGSLICQNCNSPLVGLGTIILYWILQLGLVGLVGFYLWNRGAGFESYYVGWIAVYLTILLLLRNEGVSFFYGSFLVVVVGLIVAQQVYEIPVYIFSQISTLAIISLSIFLLGGLVFAWISTTKEKNTGLSLGGSFSVLLFFLAIISFSFPYIPTGWFPETVGLFNLTIPRKLIINWQSLFLIQRGLYSNIPLLLGSLSVITFLLRGAAHKLRNFLTTNEYKVERKKRFSRYPIPVEKYGEEVNLIRKILRTFFYSSSLPVLAIIDIVGSCFFKARKSITNLFSKPAFNGELLVNAKKLLKEALRFISSFITVYSRRVLLPTALVFSMGYSFNLLIRLCGNFIYGSRVAFVFIVLDVIALCVELFFFYVFITSSSVMSSLGGMTYSLATILGLTEVSVVITGLFLWVIAKILPMFSMSERFSPLLLARPLGVYTWLSLFMILTSVTYFLYARFRTDQPNRSNGNG